MMNGSIEAAELERVAFEVMAEEQRPHPMRPAYSAEELQALGREEATKALARRRKELQQAADDPFEHGWFFDSWHDVLWETARLRVENPGIPAAMGIAGSNGAGKTQMLARFYTLAMDQCTPDQPEHQRTFWTFSQDDDKSAEVVESALRFWQPLEYKTETGRLRKLELQKLGYDKAGGFTNNECLIPTGAVCRFKTWAQDLGKLEGPRPVTGWGEEAVPSLVLDGAMNRLLTASEETLPMIATWKELLAEKERNPDLKFPLDLVGKLLVGMLFVTYTFKDGMTETVRWLLEQGTTMREIEADPDLLPRCDAAGVRIGGEMLPSLVYGKSGTRRTMWLYAWQNPLGGNWEGMKKTEKGSPRAKILWKCYGVAEGTADSPFPNFNVQVHVRPIASWLPPHDIVTWYNWGDPNASGGRNWFLLWACVLGEQWNHMGPGDIFIAHEWPQTNDRIVIPGLAVYTGEDCEWALPGGKDGLGVAGLAQKQWGVGYAWRASEIRRVEAKLAEMQGVREMQDPWQESMLRVEMRILDVNSGNTKVEGVAEAKSPIQWMRDQGLCFVGSGKESGSEDGRRVVTGEQNINSMLMWDREKAVIDPLTGWREISPKDGRGPRVRIASQCTNLIGALTHYPGCNVAGARSSAWKDPIDALRYGLNAQPEHVDARSYEPRGGLVR